MFFLHTRHTSKRKQFILCKRCYKNKAVLLLTLSKERGKAKPTCKECLNKNYGKDTNLAKMAASLFKGIEGKNIIVVSEDKNDL
jgi:hypothetical protein